MINFGIGDSLLFLSSASIHRAHEQIKQPGALAKAKGFGWCIAARFEALGALFCSLADTLAEPVRLVLTPIRILLDGGFSKSSLSRIAKATGAIATRTLLRPIAAIGSIISPEITLGAMSLSSHLDKLSLIYRMQTAGLGALNKKKWASSARSEATDLAFNRLEDSRKTILFFPDIKLDSTSSRALTKVVFDKYAPKGESTEKKIKAWRKIVSSGIGSNNPRDENMGGIVLLEIGQKMLELKEKKVPNENLWKAAFFDFLNDCKSDEFGRVFYSTAQGDLYLSDLGLVKRDTHSFSHFYARCEKLSTLFRKLENPNDITILTELLQSGKSEGKLSDAGNLFNAKFNAVFLDVKDIIDQFELSATDSSEKILNKIAKKGTGGFWQKDL
jgi:hypothetical protein